MPPRPLLLPANSLPLALPSESTVVPPGYPENGAKSLQWLIILQRSVCGTTESRRIKNLKQFVCLRSHFSVLEESSRCITSPPIMMLQASRGHPPPPRNPVPSLLSGGTPCQEKPRSPGTIGSLEELWQTHPWQTHP